MAKERQQHSEEVARLSEELRTLRDNYELKIREYEELMDLKIQLDQEIATYRALLQEEETRWVWQGVGFCCVWGEVNFVSEYSQFFIVQVICTYMYTYKLV